MKIAFLHYHLKTGGVTTVIKHQVQALEPVCDVLAISGAAPDAPLAADTITVSGIGYDQASAPAKAPEAVAEEINAAIHSKWKDGCDLLHVHNPTLAKNRQYLKILKALQKMKVRLLLQIHDFAEDGRPQNYFNEDYPADCHYAVINSRDYHILHNCGLKAQGLHIIPNAVAPVPSIAQAPRLQKRILYPVRARRRKNVGEAILLSLFFKHRENLAITMPPGSAMDRMSHQGWKRFVEQMDLNVSFDLGLKHDFFQLVHTSKFLITTSITEGFGFSFLEPWLARKLLWGRKLPDICRDFEENQVNLAHLYTHLRVPLAWIDESLFRQAWQDCLRQTADCYNYPLTAGMIAKGYRSITSAKSIDFGILSEFFQKQIITKICEDHSRAEVLCRLNPFLSDPGKVSRWAALINGNRAAVLRHYNPSQYRQRLLKIYAKVVAMYVRHSINKKALVAAFLNPHRFSLLKWGAYIENNVKGHAHAIFAK